jgi:tetratricopeptide (TPR) repeat protein
MVGTRVLAVFLVALFLLGPLLTLAIGPYTASYLIELYEKSRSEISSIVGNITTNTTNITTTNTTGNYSYEWNWSNQSAGNYTSPYNYNWSYNWSFGASRCSNAQEEISGILSKADSYIAEAKALLSSGNYREAAKLALKAINTLGRAWIIIGQCYAPISIQTNATVNVTTNTTTNLTTNATNLTNVTKVAPGLLVAILRHEVRLSRLKAMISAAGNASLNVSEAENLSKQVEALLEQARAYALAGDKDTAAQLMAKANSLMSQIVKFLKESSSKAVKEGKVEKIKGMKINATIGDKLPPGIEKKEEKGKKPEVPPGQAKKEGKGKPESPGKGKKS